MNPKLPRLFVLWNHAPDAPAYLRSLWACRCPCVVTAIETTPEGAQQTLERLGHSGQAELSAEPRPAAPTLH